jgi:hypothetical protein
MSLWSTESTPGLFHPQSGKYAAAGDAEDPDDDPDDGEEDDGEAGATSTGCCELCPPSSLWL